MLTPQKIQDLSDPIESVYIAMTNELLVNIGRHITSPTWTHTAAWEIQKLSELGQLTQENAAIINRWIKSLPQEIRDTMEETRRVALEDIEKQMERAAKAGIEGYVLPRKQFDSNRAMTVALVELLKKLDIQLVVLAGCMVIFTEELVKAYPNAIMNVHPALIPSFCGAGFYGLHVHEKALQYGVKLSGATVHFVSEECDGGPIIAQKAVAVREDDTPETLQKRIMEEAEWKLLPQAVALFCQGRIAVEGRKVIIKEE